MDYLEKGNTLFARDESGELLPQNVVLETLPNKPSIKVVPMTRGALQALVAGLKSDGNTTKDQDADIILKHCVEPAYSEEEVKFLKPKIANAIVTAIMSLSTDVSQKDMLTVTKEAALTVADDIKKKMTN